MRTSWRFAAIVGEAARRLPLRRSRGQLSADVVQGIGTAWWAPGARE